MMTTDSGSQTASHQQIGERLRTLRIKKGWTAREAAQAASREAPETLSISTGRWQNWECDQRKPSLQLLPILARTLGTTPEYLAGWHVEPTHDDASSPSMAGEELTFSTQTLTKHGMRAETVTLIRVSDDAMAPDFSRGDLVLVDTTRRHIGTNGVYALGSDDAPLLRFVRKELGQGVTVYGNDEKHAPAQYFSDEAFADVNVVGEVVFKGRWLLGS